MSAARRRTGPRVLVVASEAHPLAKTGGLGDVAGALPPALRAVGVDARLLVPGYPGVLGGTRLRPAARALRPLPGLPAVDLLEGRMPDGETPLVVVDCPALYAREGGPYQDADGADWPDNPLRFGMLGRVAALLAAPGGPLAWRPDVLHCNDWQAGLACAYVALEMPGACRTLESVHNIAFAGAFDPALMGPLGLPAWAFQMYGLEFHGALSFLKAGLYYADHVSTVSPGYAREIRTPAFGGGFDGLLETRADRLTGILNGIDTAVWDPASDPHLPRRYGAERLGGKRACRVALLRTVGLAEDEDAALLGMVTRATWQKGVDLVPGALARLGDAAPCLIVLGTGDPGTEAALRDLEAAHPRRVRFVNRYDEALAHLIYAGADLFVMPSRFEPCGLSQMYAMRYGTPPIARRTGGLADTVVHAAPEALERGEATGFVFDGDDEASLAGAIAEALALRADARAWRALQRAGMGRDFGWEARAEEYRALYERMLA